MGKKARCNICKRSFAEQRSVLRHMQSTHNMQKFECKVCNKEFARLDILYQHLKTKTHKTNDRNIKMTPHSNHTNDSVNKSGALGQHDKLLSYNTQESINDGTSNIETGDLDEDVDEEIDSTLPIIYSYDDEDSILSMNWEDSIEQLRAAAEAAEERRDTSYPSLVRRTEQSPKQTFNSSLPTQFEGNVFTYSELLRIAKGEEHTSTAVGPTREVHDLRLPSDIKVDHDECITIPSDDEEPPDKQLTEPVYQAATSSTTKRLYGESVQPPDRQLPEPDDRSPSANAAKRLRRENDVLVDSNVFDMLKKKTLDANDEDQMFLLSILSDFRKVLPQNKLKVKIKIAQAIADGS